MITLKRYKIVTDKTTMIISAPNKTLAKLNFKYDHLKEYANANYIKISAVRKK